MIGNWLTPYHTTPMRTFDNYPAGAANDPRAPYNEPLARNVRVEVGVELGTMVDIEVVGDLSENIMQELVRDKIIEKLNIDNEDIVLNNIIIYSHDDLSSK